MADVQINPITIESGREAALSLLLSIDRKAFEQKYPNLNSSTPAQITTAEQELMKSYSEEDRFGYYHVATLENSNANPAPVLTQVSSKTDFLSNPNRTEWSHHVFSNSKVGFTKYVLNEKRFERTVTEADGTERQVSQVEARDLLLYCEAEIVEHQQKKILILKFPWYRRKLSQAYFFGEEINYISNWISQTLKVKITPFPLKLFFEAFRPHSYYDKSEFYVKTLNSANGTYPMDMKVGSDLNGLTNAYANLDKVLSTTISASMAEKFAEQIRKSELPDQDDLIEFATNFFKTQGISSQEFFEVLHQTFEYGLGRITYSKGKEFVHFKLDYTEDVPGLIRASKLGEEVFEHLWGEIKKYLS